LYLGRRALWCYSFTGERGRVLYLFCSGSTRVAILGRFVDVMEVSSGLSAPSLSFII